MSEDQIQALKEPRGAERDVFNDDERAAIQFAEMLTGWPGSANESRLEALGKQFSEDQIVELVLTVATANLTNRFNEGLRTPVDV